MTARERAALANGEANPPRLALFTDSFGPEVNGVVRSLERLVDEVRGRGGAVRVFAPAAPGARAEPQVLRWPSVPCWPYPQLRLAPPLAGAAVRELRSWKPTIVHAATPMGVGVAGRAAAMLLRVPLVTSYHTHLSAYASFYQLGGIQEVSWHYHRWFHNSGARTFVPTHAVADELRGRGFQRLALWSRGVDLHRFSPGYRSEDLRQALGASDQVPLVIYVGRLAAEKNLGTALAASRLALRQRPGGFALALVGDGPYELEARRLAPASAHFLGRLAGTELSRVYASADLLLFPSTTDTFGNVQLEAMASGVPVVAADCPVNREVLGDAGYLVPAHDTAALANAILSLQKDPELRATLASRGRRRSETATWSRVFDQLLHEYAAVEAEHRGIEQLPRTAA